MHLLSTRAGHPELQSWKYPLPGDSVVSMIHRVVIDLSNPTPSVVRFKMPADQHRSTVCDHITCVNGEFADVQWYPDASKLAFVSSSRDHKIATLRIADAATGDVRDVLREEVKTQFESGDNVPNWRVLPASKRGALVLAARRLGPALPVRPRHRRAQEQGDDRRRQRGLHRAARREGAPAWSSVSARRRRDPYFRHFYRIAWMARA